MNERKKKKKKKIVNKWKYLFMKIYFMSFFLPSSLAHSVAGCCSMRYRIYIAFMSSSEKKAIFVHRRHVIQLSFFVLFLVARSCISLEWHRFEFFMQIEGWWDKNKLYNCRWNGRAATATTVQPERREAAVILWRWKKNEQANLSFIYPKVIESILWQHTKKRREKWCMGDVDNERKDSLFKRNEKRTHCRYRFVLQCFFFFDWW